jgi:hypothetical protein
VIALGHPVEAGATVVHLTDRFAVVEGGTPPV